MKREVEVSRFKVKSDGGIEYLIVEYQEILSMKFLSEPSSETKGMKILRTNTGLPVEYIDAKTFKIFGTGEIVRKV